MKSHWLCILSILAFTAVSAQGKAPNILFIAVDDMNDWVGPLGGLSITQTPNLDKLANESMVFTNAHRASLTWTSVGRDMYQKDIQ